MSDWLCLAAVFVLGAVVGGFLAKCIERLPLEKSLLWPGSRCQQCLQPIAWRDSIPLVSFWLRRGRCRTCGQPFSLRFFAIELLTALGFAGLYYLEVLDNIHEFDRNVLGKSRYDWGTHVAFGYHAILFCFLVVATFIDYDHLIIPLPLTIVGSVVGLVGSIMWPWPWPYAAGDPGVVINNWLQNPTREGLYPWPVWGPPPAWAPAGSLALGLTTGLAGLLMGTLALRVVRVCFGIGMGPEYMDEEDPHRKPRTVFGRTLSWFQRVGGKTMGLGDADLMMMAGAFVGWQPVLVSFFVATFPGLVFGIAQLVVQPDEPPPSEPKAFGDDMNSSAGYHQLPFGPALAIGVMLTVLFWKPIGERVQPVLFFKEVLIAIAVMSCFLMIVAGYILRFLRTRGT
jgi:leader peptidase (prepilin peptidase)/N-methyltransferase